MGENLLFSSYRIEDTKKIKEEGAEAPSLCLTENRYRG